MKEIQILYLDGCPHYVPTLELVRDLVSELGLDVTDNESAAALCFPGSPTVRVDGRDIEPGLAVSTYFGMSCRRYGLSGTPPREMVRGALVDEAE